MAEQTPEKAEPRVTVADAIAAWEAKGPTSLTVALMADALYGAREQLPAFVASDAVQYALTVAAAGLRTEAEGRLRDAADQWPRTYALAPPAERRACALTFETPDVIATCLLEPGHGGPHHDCGNGIRWQTRVLPPEPDLAWCGERHPGACHVPDSTGVCELRTRLLPPDGGRA